jgi:hypothetical protein
MPLTFTALPTDSVRALQAGGPDANGQTPERQISDGEGNPCRHCLQDIPAGAQMLVLAYRPFPSLQPYAEMGPVFLCADPCQRGGGADLPAILSSDTYVLRGYGSDDRIVYGTGAVIARDRILAEAALRLALPNVAYVHIRSARNTCFQVRVDHD